MDEKIKTSFLSWTTPPWTIPGNVALSVNPNLDYSLLEVKVLGIHLIVVVVGTICELPLTVDQTIT